MYLPYDFKKARPPTFDGDVKKLEDEEAWLLGMKKFFELHDHIHNMNSKIVIFNLKGKVDIWCEDVKCVTGITTKELIWHEFKRLFRKKYLPKRYYDGKSKESYELKMGSITNEKYMIMFIELLRYVSYLKDENKMTIG